VIPLKDDVPTQSFPLVSVALIATNVLVYLYEFFLWIPGGSSRAAAIAGERAYEGFIFEFGLIPCRLGEVCPAKLATIFAAAPAPWLTVFTSMFVHAGFFHFAGNMLYLWIFGNNIEDSMGKIRFTIFYLLSGLGAAAGQILVNPGSRIPMVGASGAVSGVLGAYLLLFPHARVLTLIPLGFFTQVTEIPAIFVLGFWIVVQLVNGLLTFNFQGGGVAWFAHIGGFTVGMLLVGLFKRRTVSWGWQRPRARED